MASRHRRGAGGGAHSRPTVFCGSAVPLAEPLNRSYTVGKVAMEIEVWILLRPGVCDGARRSDRLGARAPASRRLAYAHACRDRRALFGVVQRVVRIPRSRSPAGQWQLSRSSSNRRDHRGDRDWDQLLGAGRSLFGQGQTGERTHDRRSIWVRLRLASLSFWSATSWRAAARSWSPIRFHVHRRRLPHSSGSWDSQAIHNGKMTGVKDRGYAESPGRLALPDR